MENESKTRLSRQNRGTTGRKLRTPSYRRHRGSGQAVVTLGGRDHYLGRWGSKASKAEYDRLVAEWLTGGRMLPDRTGGAITVVEVIAAYLRHAGRYYRRADGSQTSEVENVKAALRPVRRLYGHTLATDFGPIALEAVRTTMVASGLSRGVINKAIDRVKRAFRWAAQKELIPVAVYDGLRTLPGLRMGRSEAREVEPVRPVAEADIDAIKPYVSSVVWSMIRVQLLTACRPGEVVAMRPMDLDTTGPTWTYTPPQHKNAWRGKARTVYLGPRAQAVLAPFLSGRAVDAPMFNPREAESERHAKAVTHRRPNQKANPKKTAREVGDRYTVDAYRRAVHYACNRAGVPRWGVNRLRHNAASEIRRTFGLEGAQVMLGHATADVTQVYAERDAAKAVEIASKVG